MSVINYFGTALYTVFINLWIFNLYIFNFYFLCKYHLFETQ